MENKKITTAQIATSFGLLLGGINILYGIMLFTLDMHYQNDTATSLIGYGFLIGIIIWGIMRFKKINNGYIKLSEALKTGVGTALISGIVIAIYFVIMSQYIDPEFINKSIEYQKQKMLQENPEISLESVDKIFDMQKEFSGPIITSGFIIIFNLFFGFIISLVVGLILKKSQPE
ncbi:MAG: DUF4199 domain-containing protein [Bacteroidota bacterium]|nr:DUF4199 domain-containing protein [Bacteroidota bacterium]